MTTFGKRLFMLRKENEMSQDDIANYLQSTLPDCKINKSSISRYEKDRTTPNRFDIAEALARLFKVSVSYIMARSDNRYGDDVECRTIPVLGRIAAGVPLLAQEDMCGHECIAVDDRIDFCLHVKGNSMVNAGIFDGDIVFIRQQSDVDTGAIAVVVIDEEATLKRVYKVDSNIILRAENPANKDIVITKKDRKSVSIIGKAIYVKSEVM